MGGWVIFWQILFVLSRKKREPPKDYHFETAMTHVCVSGGKKYSFFGKCSVLCFLVISVLRFVPLPCYLVALWRQLCHNLVPDGSFWKGFFELKGTPIQIWKSAIILSSHKMICRRFRIKKPFTLWDTRTWDKWKVSLQTFRNNRIRQKLAYFLRNLQT